MNRADGEHHPAATGDHRLGMHGAHRSRSLDIKRFDAVTDFLAHAGEWLVAREAEHNLILGICTSLAENPTYSEGPPLLATVADGDRIVAAAIRTPPWNLVLSEVDDPGALGVLLDDLLLAGDAARLPGVLGPVEHAATFARLWSSRTGVSVTREIGERVFSLTTVRPQRPVPGARRQATQADRDLLVAWFAAFHDEAFGRPAPVDSATLADRWLVGGSRTMWLWQLDDGTVVSLCGIAMGTPNGFRIGPVYTPPDLRGHGYASNLVAEVTQAGLDAGKRFGFLFTDLANPTSNHIYQAIGYEPVRDIEQWGFEARR